MTAAADAAQSSGAAFEAWVDGQHRVAKAAGHLVWVDHYGPEVQHLSGGAVRVVGHAPPDYLGQLRGGRVVFVEAKRRTGRLAIEDAVRAASILLTDAHPSATLDPPWRASYARWRADATRAAQTLPRGTHAQRRLERAAWEILAAAGAIAEAADA